MTHDCKRNSTAPLFAAPKLAEGWLIETCIEEINAHPRTYTWPAKAEDTLEKSAVPQVPWIRWQQHESMHLHETASRRSATE